MRWIVTIAFLILLPMGALADERVVRLAAPEALVETGLLKHILPRFSLKTQVRVEIVDDANMADVVLGPTGRPLFRGAGATWHLHLRRKDHAGSKRFAGWLNSDVGQRTVFGFAPDGKVVFEAPDTTEVEVATVALNGDPQLGLDVSRSKCARCHAIEEAGRKNDIGSTPSFFVLRSLNDWQERFEAFYVLNPHPAFTQIEDVTEPFPVDRPSPIVPIQLTLDELEAVLAYVSVLEAADLGSPLVHQ